MSRPVVVGVDGTADALRAVRWAAEHAGPRGADLRLVHAASSPACAARVVREARDVVYEVAAGLPVSVVTGELPSAELLVRESAGASFVVLGSRGRGGFSGLLIGTTAVTVAARGGCPMVVMGGPDERGDGPVVVGVDGTVNSDAAIDFALREASLRGTGLVAVHGLIAPVEGNVTPDRVAETIAERLADRGARYPEVKVVQEVVADTPGRALLDRAASAQLAVVGSGRRIGYRGALLRSTSQYLLHQAPCPVAVVRRDHPI
ncbi:universal stress protein [Actinophytocola sp. NPDC049390]|uniref:universal stress protein n=1 Tax=Actinophytocola sp. NPDC049390 TaxID=3363894 RepID=UPI0037AEFE8E